MIKKRSRVIGVFPNAKSCIRYVSCLLMEIDEDWHTGRRYMKMDYLEEDKEFLDEEIMEEIKMVKEGVRTNEELVAQ
jgi:transposase-like protein